MQVARHWRMKKQTYRLEGVQYENGQNALLARPMMEITSEAKPEAIREVLTQQTGKVAAA